MKKTLFKIFDKFTEKVDTYHNNGSMWFIFTDEKKWVIELTNEGTLWYNFYFFQDCFKYLSLDVVENQHYITEWVEDTIQNGVRSTITVEWSRYGLVEDTIQNGVRSTRKTKLYRYFSVEDTIQNGVRSTDMSRSNIMLWVENTIQNGVKHTEDSLKERMFFVEDTIQNGVKRTELGGKDRKIDEIKDIVENGIKETHEDAYHNKGRVEGVIRNGIIETRHGIHFFEDTTENVIKNGVKETKSPGADGDLLSTIEWMESNNAESVPEMIDNVIENGIKEVKELPDQSGELNGYGEYYARQKNMTYPHTDIVNDVITDGIKYIKKRYRQPYGKVEDIIQKGINKTNWRKVDNHPTYLDHILIKE